MIRHQDQSEDAHDRVERGVRQAGRAHVRLVETHDVGEPGPLCLVASGLEHLPGQVHAEDLAMRGDGPAGHDRGRTRAAGDIEHVHPGREVEVPRTSGRRRG